MMKTLFGAATLAIAIAATPASAQLLGGSGGGGLGGSLGGAMGGVGGSLSGAGSGALGGMIGRTPINTDSATRSTGSARADKKVDVRKGRVNASGTTTADNAIDSSTEVSKGSLTTGSSGSTALGGSVDAQLVGTDTVRGAGNQAMGTTRNAAGRAETTTRNVADRGRSAASNATSRATDSVNKAANSVGAAGSAGGSAMGSLGGNGAGAMGNLALAGSGAANAGAFSVMPGMEVRDAKGNAIGAVQSVRNASGGRVSDVLVQVGKRTVTLPASNFSGSGDVLVSAMGKGDVKKRDE